MENVFDESEERFVADTMAIAAAVLAVVLDVVMITQSDPTYPAPERSSPCSTRQFLKIRETSATPVNTTRRLSKHPPKILM